MFNYTCNEIDALDADYPEFFSAYWTDTDDRHFQFDYLNVETYDNIVWC